MDDNQIVIPRSFIELFIPAGRSRPSEPRDVIAARYELCEDLAQMLVETATTKMFELGVTEVDVLERIHAGLVEDPAAIQPHESTWVVRRLAEIMEWPLPQALRVDRT